MCSGFTFHIQYKFRVRVYKINKTIHLKYIVVHMLPDETTLQLSRALVFLHRQGFTYRPLNELCEMVALPTFTLDKVKTSCRTNIEPILWVNRTTCKSASSNWLWPWSPHPSVFTLGDCRAPWESRHIAVTPQHDGDTRYWHYCDNLHIYMNIANVQLIQESALTLSNSLNLARGIMKRNVK